MTTCIIPVEPYTITVFGASGDLARRKLYPALWRRLLAGQSSTQSRIVGVARSELSQEEFRNLVEKSLLDAGALTCEKEKERLADFLATLTYFQLDVTSDHDGWQSYAAIMRELPRPQLFYFAIAPTLAIDLCHRLKQCGVLDDGGRLILEKPFGNNYQTAHALNSNIKDIISENNIYRIDHYLGKETVQNLMALRFANALLEPLWNGNAIDHVQITVAEDIGISGRGGYYDGVGVVRDMLQNHILQLLCLVGMEIPANYRADNVRDEKLKVLRSLRPFAAKDLQSQVVIGQYSASNGNPSYLQDIEQTHSNTPTYVALKCYIDNWRWANVPFYLRTGKRLRSRMSEIAVSFRHAPHSIFPTVSGALPQNELVIRLQPSEGIKLHVNIKEPGPGGFRLATVPLDMSFAESLGIVLPDAYERLLMDVVRGDQTLFMRSDEVEAAWTWADPMIAYIESNKPELYMCGSSGPDDALRLMHADGRKWREISE